MRRNIYIFQLFLEYGIHSGANVLDSAESGHMHIP